MDLTQKTTDSAFHNVARQLIEASVAAWPTDALLPLALQTWDQLEPTRAVELFQAHFGPLLKRLGDRDETALFEASEHEALKAIDIRQKYETANESTRNTVWVYMGHMCRFATMKTLYQHVPSEILSAVSDAANDLKTKLDTGAVTAEGINPMELGQQLMSKFKPEDLERMMKSFMANPDAMNNLMATVSGLQGPNGLSGMPNLEPFMQLFGRPG